MSNQIASNAKNNAIDIKNALSNEILARLVSYDTQGSWQHTGGDGETIGDCLNNIIESLKEIENK